MYVSLTKITFSEPTTRNHGAHMCKNAKGEAHLWQKTHYYIYVPKVTTVHKPVYAGQKDIVKCLQSLQSFPLES